MMFLIITQCLSCVLLFYIIIKIEFLLVKINKIKEKTNKDEENDRPYEKYRNHERLFGNPRGINRYE